ncbi:hypothetical protein BRD56_09090 [Thermoplasmatales archaeon SW_10_69_26]|nr:MAG: hypothetical protein BRD56_09090 [Thermoplasmatales archaeon SW_10_69_26]
MRTRALFAATILLAAALGGCLGLGGDEGTDAETASSDDPFASETNRTNGTANETTGASAETGPQPEIHWQNATVGGQDLPVLGWLCNPCQDNGMEFNATNETTMIVAQAFWEADVQLDVDLDVPSEACETNFPSDNDCQPDTKTGSSPVEFRITNPADLHAGDWSFSAWPENNPNRPAEVTMVVGVFAAEDPPRQWSKVPTG